LGIHLTALTVEIQRLETDTEGRLYKRATYGKPQRPTRHGQALLDALHQPHTEAALRDAAGPAPPPPDSATLDTLRAERSTRAPARPAAAYPGLSVQPQRWTTATLGVLAYLVDHADHDVWGYLVAKELHLHHGTVYPILTRLHDGGWTQPRRNASRMASTITPSTRRQPPPPLPSAEPRRRSCRGHGRTDVGRPDLVVGRETRQSPPM